MRCDSHVHIVGPVETCPQAPERTYLAPPAPLERLRRVAAPCGIERFVVVQPSFYGADNAALLESLDALAGRGRGVAVIDPTMIAAAELAGYARRGVRGLRVNLYTPKDASDRQKLAPAFVATAKLAQTMNWHVEVITPLPALLQAADLLTAASVPVVIDHYGVYRGEVPSSAAGRGLLDLLRHPHLWIKLSAPYRVSDDPLCTWPDPEWLAAILAVAAERCVWGSDWPHTPPHEAAGGPGVPGVYRTIAYEKLVDDFVAALASAALTDRILSANPARLYGFEPP
jgi:predicted TIM-barrel fold metal-dependent hydrolase